MIITTPTGYMDIPVPMTTKDMQEMYESYTRNMYYILKENK